MFNSLGGAEIKVGATADPIRLEATGGNGLLYDRSQHHFIGGRQFHDRHQRLIGQCDAADNNRVGGLAGAKNQTDENSNCWDHCGSNWHPDHDIPC